MTGAPLRIAWSITLQTLRACAAVQEAGFQRVALLGSQITAEAPFYRQRLQSHHGVEAMVQSA